MKKYFYSNGEEKNGPFSLDELKNEDIKDDTLVWFEGLDDWTSANQIEVMKPILELIPPPISDLNKKRGFQKTNEKPKEEGSTE